MLYGFPPQAAWPWIAVTVVLGTGALLLLGSAYREGDFAVAYPLIRGLIPLVLAVAAVPLFAERPTTYGAAGIVCVSAGLVLIAWESARRTRTMTLKGLAFAALAAGVTAASVVSDAKGARVSGNPFSYAATISVLNAIVMAAIWSVRTSSLPAMLTAHGAVAAGGAMIATVSYILFIWSLMQAPVAMVAARRDRADVRRHSSDPALRSVGNRETAGRLHCRGDERERAALARPGHHSVAARERAGG
jgi:drug/metabolite transporter (DMT)-like permease